MAGIHEETELGVVYDRVLVGKLLAYARPHAAALLGCVVLLLLDTVLLMGLPYVLKLAIDRAMVPGLAVPPQARAPYLHALWLFSAMYVFGSSASALIEYGESLWLRVTGQKIIAAIRQDLFEHLQQLGLAFYDANPAGRLVTRVTNDIEALNEMYTSVLVNLFKDCFMILGAAVVMLRMDWRLALVSFAVVPFVMAAAALFQRLARKGWREVRVRIAAINARISEDLSGVRLIQLFARERLQNQEFHAVNQAAYDAAMYQLGVYAVFRPLLELITSFALVGLIWFGGHEVLATTLSIGTLFAFTTYIRRLYDPINALAEKYNILQSALAAAERIFQLFATEPAITDRHERVPALVPGAPAVEFRDVWFAYVDEDWVLRGVSFAVPQGATVGFVGHTGAGKSTIMGLVARFYDVQRGAVLVDGVDVRDWPQAALRRRVGTVMQDVFLFAGDIAGNIDLGEPGLDVQAAARLVGAEGFIQALPGGYGAEVVERGMTLSAGQRQLLSFARALAYNPAVLVLDEATASVDSETEALLQQAVAAARGGRTTLVVAHRLSTIIDAQRIFVLHKGVLREQGTHAELLQQPDGLYARLWQLQSGTIKRLTR